MGNISGTISYSPPEIYPFLLEIKKINTNIDQYEEKKEIEIVNAFKERRCNLYN